MVATGFHESPHPCNTNKMPADMTKEFLKSKLDETVDQITEVTKRLQKLHLRNDGKKFRLGDLPAELFYRVGKNMPTESTLSLSATCRDFQGILFPITKKADEASRSKFRHLQDRDKLAVCIEHERTSGLDDPLRACGACSRLHHIRYFTSTQLLNPPKLRKCRGRARIFKPCEHTTYTWDAVARIPPSDNLQGDDDGVTNDRFHCQKCSDEGSEGKLFRFRRTRQKDPCPPNTGSAIDESKTVQITKYRLLAKIYPGWVTEGKLVADRLGQWQRQVCPHTVTTKDTFPNLSSLKFKFADEKGGKEISDELQAILPKKTTSYCTQPGCNAKLFIDVTEGIISLGITRDLGVMEAPDEPEWLIQTEDAPIEREESWRERLYREGWWPEGSLDVINNKGVWSDDEEGIWPEIEYSDDEYSDDESSDDESSDDESSDDGSGEEGKLEEGNIEEEYTEEEYYEEEDFEEEYYDEEKFGVVRSGW
ncbi:hypothetical protein BC567DRAFT_262535 [Phyllosticta citribraziliensis]